MATKRGGNDLEKLAEALRDPSFRKAFAADPAAAAKAQGVKEKEIPEELFAVLADLSHEELRALQMVKEALDRTGVSDAIKVQMV